MEEGNIIIRIVLSIIAVMILALGAIVYFRQKKEKLNQIYFWLALSISFWVFSRGMMEQAALGNILFWVKAHYLTALLMANFALLFAAVLVYQKRIYRFINRLAFAALFTDLGLAYLIINGNAVIADARFIDGLINVVFGPFYPYYVYFLGFYFLSTLAFFGRGFSRSFDEAAKGQFKLVIFGSLISISVGFITNLILPWLGYFNFFWVGPVAILALIFSFDYAISKYHLFNIKIIATELLVFIVWIAMLAEVLLAETLEKRLLESGILVFVVIFGVLIIKSVIREIKQREDLEILSKKLEAANERLKELDKLKSDFVSIASHQLRSPLTVIKGYGSMILEGSFGGTSVAVKNAVEKIYQSSERLIDFVNDLLDVSRIERGKMQYSFEKADIFEIVSSVVEEFQLVAKKKGLILKLKKNNVKIPPLKLDVNKIRQIILNFIDNGIKYTSQGSIIASALKTEKDVEIRVEDTGFGIDKEDQEKIFDQFMRINAGAAGGIGAGLGLYVARKIAQAHGGEVFVESEGKGRGSTFILRLPVRKN
ncbi:MAG: ATP-binding protein [Patescibacteria group bacterium]